ncbi:MAG TPA: UDP-N-acetylmuramate--L-alanine ligase [Catenuloplanes sp.]
MTITGHSDPSLDPYLGPIDLRRPHFVGIGGSTMSALASICAARGRTVTGSDVADSPRLAHLRAAGCQISIGHDTKLIEQATCVVYTAATEHTEEVIMARIRGFPVVHHAQVLQTLATGQHLVAVSGTHGKSTTTGILAAALSMLGADPSYAIGADLHQPGSGAHHGTTDLFIAEADESDRSLHFLAPYLAVLTGIAHDHPENYPDLRAHIEAYTTFACGLEIGGLLVVNADDPGAMDVADRTRRERRDVTVITYGQTPDADWHIEAIEQHGWSSTVRIRPPHGGTLTLRLSTPSAHHARDAVAALAALASLGFDALEAAPAIGAFRGVRRRLTRTGQAAGVTVIDSYAHHPNEITADLQAARTIAGAHKVIVVFQPSGYDRVAALGREMGAALAAGADEVILLDVQGGTPRHGITSRIVADAITAHGGRVHCLPADHAPSMAGVLAFPGDVVLTMGTGDVTQLGDRLVNSVAALIESRQAHPTPVG